jgi:hypothetical protein
MSRPAFRRARHRVVENALSAFNADFLQQVRCFFGGGTRIVLDLGEYRESEDLYFLCSSRDGYRALRTAVSERSLGPLLAVPLPLARDVRADQYGIRTFLEVDGHRLKCEVIREGRIDVLGGRCEGIPVPCLDRRSCLAEKWLANADRWSDAAVLSRDIVDLAFMVEAWDPDDVAAGREIARQAYGDTVDRAARSAALKLLEDDGYRRRCVRELGIQGVETLQAGLETLISIA